MKFSNKSLIVFFVIFFIQGASFLSGHVLPSLDGAESDKLKEIVYEEDVPTALTSKKPTVILAYMENCNHCQHLKPFFKKQSLKMPGVTFLIVNGPKLSIPKYVTIRSKEQKLLNPKSHEFRIIGFPSIIFVKDGSIIDLQTGGSPGALAEKLIKNFK